MRATMGDMSEIAAKFAAWGGVTTAQAHDYLKACDDVAPLPGGALVRRGATVHIVAPQTGLSGRALVNATRAALVRFHEAVAMLVCPIHRDNARTLRYAQHFGFKSYGSTETHRWLCRHRGDAL
jgi:hypothetical protein